MIKLSRYQIVDLWKTNIVNGQAKEISEKGYKIILKVSISRGGNVYVTKGKYWENNTQDDLIM